ncbi:Uncharacterized protein dnm_067720 [Desulfonema magnum]|uniref:Uncharacterized protein n=1 Tax=Desulfonema magnum TaxID=45655 RepID=A0A975BS96_9BACT|nr:Uncharacterized protein dnm_067720 [Desulfonema magnum]
MRLCLTQWKTQPIALARCARIPGKTHQKPQEILASFF